MTIIAALNYFENRKPKGFILGCDVEGAFIENDQIKFYGRFEKSFKGLSYLGMITGELMIDSSIPPSEEFEKNWAILTEIEKGSAYFSSLNGIHEDMTPGRIYSGYPVFDNSKYLLMLAKIHQGDISLYYMTNLKGEKDKSTLLANLNDFDKSYIWFPQVMILNDKWIPDEIGAQLSFEEAASMLYGYINVFTSLKNQKEFGHKLYSISNEGILDLIICS